MNICFLRFHRISKALLHRPYYDNQRAWQRISGYQATNTAIQNPFIYYYVNNNDWSSSHSYQFWNKNFTTAMEVNNEETIKTIYSPSPSGFVEPKTAAFTGFTSTGGNTSNSSLFNVSGSYNRGWHFYTNGWKAGGTIFFDSFGFRYVYSGTYGTVAYDGDIGYCWTVGAYSTSRGRNLAFLPNTVNAQDNDCRSAALTCRSVKE